jgi:ADP-ribose pyrophosphatase
MEKNPWITLDSEMVYESQWIKVTKSNVINPAGNPAIYSWVHFKNLAIGIVPMDTEKNIWLVGQFRYPINEYSWEIPEGGGLLDINPVNSAERELLEETGIKAKCFNEFLRMRLSNSATDELSITYLATDLQFQEASPEESEVLQIKKINLDAAYLMMNEGKITDSITVASILKLKLLDISGELNKMLGI